MHDDQNSSLVCNRSPFYVPFALRGELYYYQYIYVFTNCRILNTDIYELVYISVGADLAAWKVLIVQFMSLYVRVHFINLMAMPVILCYSFAINKNDTICI